MRGEKRPCPPLLVCRHQLVQRGKAGNKLKAHVVWRGGEQRIRDQAKPGPAHAQQQGAGLRIEILLVGICRHPGVEIETHVAPPQCGREDLLDKMKAAHLQGVLAQKIGRDVSLRAAHKLAVVLRDPACEQRASSLPGAKSGVETGQKHHCSLSRSVPFSMV